MILVVISVSDLCSKTGSLCMLSPAFLAIFFMNIRYMHCFLGFRDSNLTIYNDR